MLSKHRKYCIIIIISAEVPSTFTIKMREVTFTTMASIRSVDVHRIPGLWKTCILFSFANISFLVTLVHASLVSDFRSKGAGSPGNR